VDLSDDDVRHVARLARLGLTDEEVASLRSELSEILEYAERVGEAATKDVRPTGHALDLSNRYRDDEPRPSLDPADALSNAPEAEEQRFRVPRIMEEETEMRAPNEQPDGQS
jgi:aspartyl-tRNA(Asn)/glutamyl-tRNA(Gln) amidotransferase subunit C